MFLLRDLVLFSVSSTKIRQEVWFISQFRYSILNRAAGEFPRLQQGSTLPLRGRHSAGIEPVWDILKSTHGARLGGDARKRPRNFPSTTADPQNSSFKRVCTQKGEPTPPCTTARTAGHRWLCGAQAIAPSCTDQKYPPTTTRGCILNSIKLGTTKTNWWLRIKIHFMFLLRDLVLFSVSSTKIRQGFWFISQFRHCIPVRANGRMPLLKQGFNSPLRGIHFLDQGCMHGRRAQIGASCVPLLQALQQLATQDATTPG